MGSQAGYDLPKVLSHTRRACGIGDDDERVPVRLKETARSIGVLRRTVDELADSLINRLAERLVDISAQLKAMLGLNKDVTTTVSDGADVIHLLASLAADFLNPGRLNTPVGR